MYTTIYLDKDDLQLYSVVSADSEPQALKNLSRINVFVGANNSGKSRLMRSIFSIEEFKFDSCYFDSGKVNAVIQALPDVLKSRHRHGLLEPTIESRIRNIRYRPNVGRNKLNNTDIPQLQNGVALQGQKIEIKKLSQWIEDEISIYNNCIANYKRIYIPILRGLRPIHFPNLGSSTPPAVDLDNYRMRCWQDYFSKIEQGKLEIFTGLTLYEEIRKLLLGDSKQREKAKKFELFLSKNFFREEEVNLVPRIDDDVLHIKIGNEEKPIFELGDGIQSIIILTYQLFVNQGQYVTFFIEEPELHLHPGLQRILLETFLLPEFENYQYFITTHSNHFLDMTLDCDDISVYSFNKKYGDTASFAIRNVSSPNNEVLELLGVRNSSVLLSNCTIWVEGITDRLYIREYLRIYQKEKDKQYKEDLHYSFVEYGGNNITHWSFLDAEDELHPNINTDVLCGRLFLVTDRDSKLHQKDGDDVAMSKKEKRQLALKDKLGERYYCLEVREIENLLTKNVVKSVVQKVEEKKSIPKVDLDFSKFDMGNFEDVGLGAYIDDNILGLSKSYAAGSGTIKDKVGFCKEAVKEISASGNISAGARQLAKKIYDFIAQSNA